MSPDMNTMTKDGLRNLSLENLYQRFETSFGNIKSKMISGTPLDGRGDLEAIDAFVGTQLVRTPKFRDRWRFEVVGDHEAQLADITDHDLRDGLRKTLSHISANQRQLLCFFTFQRVIELLSKMRITLLRADKSQYFITSDAPCCVVEYKDKIASMFETLESETSTVVMPLSPKVAVIFDHSDQPHEMIGLFPNQSIVHELNAIIWRGAVKEIVLPNSMMNEEWFSERIDARLLRYAVL